METRVCDKCGKELPLSSFPRWVNKDGTIRAFHHCYVCVAAEQREKKKNKKREQLIQGLTNEEILKEAKRRNLL